MKKIIGRIKKWFQNKYGMDELGSMLSISGMILLVLASYFKSSILKSLAAAGLIFFVYRFFSSQHWERQEENRQFCKYIKLWKMRYEYRMEYRIYLCKRCGRFVRVPKGKGKIQVTCTACGAKMMKRT